MNPVLAVITLQYVAVTAPVWVPATVDAPQTVDRWEAHYPAKNYARRRTVEYRAYQAPPEVVPSAAAEEQTVDRWGPTYPSIPRKRRLLADHLAYQATAFQPPVVVSSGGSFIATGAVPLLQYQAIAGPFEEDTAPPPDYLASVLWRYADRTVRRAGIAAANQHAWASDKFDAPTAPTVTFFELTAPQIPVRRRVSVVHHERLEPIFGFVVPVPVMSWTGLYLDPPMKRRVRYQPESKPFPLDFDTTINPPSPTLGWQGFYPDKVERAKSRVYALTYRQAQPWHVPDTTDPVTVLSWQGRYADRVPPPRRLHASANPAWASDKFTAPAAVTTPDLAQSVYVDRAYGRRPLAKSEYYEAPSLVPDVTQPVTGVEWLALYPDWIAKATQPIALRLTYTSVVFIAEYIPAAVVGEIEGEGSFHKKLHGRGSYFVNLRGRGSL